jgi:hypothetical protein
MKRQQGFSAVEGIIVIVIVAALAFVGWWVFDRMQKDDAKNTGTSQKQETSVPEVNDIAGLDTAEQTLDDADIDAGSSDDTQLNSQLDSF